MRDLYKRLTDELDAAGAHYRVIEHEPIGQTDAVSALRGHPVSHAAKCIVLLVKVAKKESKYVLAVVPGDVRVDLTAVKMLLDGSYAGFAATERAEELAGSVSGTVLPFSYDERLELIVDPAVFDQPTLYFNAARLDRSVALASADYRRIANPRVAPIAERAT